MSADKPIMDKSLLTEQEKLLRTAYTSLSTPNRHLHLVDRNSLRELALRHTFAILPNRAFPLDFHVLNTEARSLASSFLNRYGADIWPTDNRDEGGILFERVYKYFYQLLQLPARAPEEDELLERVAVKDLKTVQQEKREEKKRMNDAEWKEGRYTISRRKSHSDLPSLPKPEWTGKTEAEERAAAALVAEGDGWHMESRDVVGEGEGFEEEEEDDADVAGPEPGRKGTPKEGFIEIHKDLANLSIGGEESGSVCTVPMDVQSTPCGEVFDTVGELKEHLEEVHGLTDATMW